ncbi:MAG: 50S ribosomal protein P1 [Candidatus Woesearchaeota archaeon]|jgi:large subunit ribosomal protein L12|nr:50S ribosomal protein P1 [Candidatus Woesearchaeota archaeon]MDP7181645.1 50S ribosomal protein P1 [Candidatus Woesearchaeota archaeon]MDP7198734.1 50S ribosomal protein P1 [Candidatus Woesearchaeota archaeon]MDP7467266.1 50S ribosomal protein P1 [Candidatus Woesearchaeota archaeon]MDP7647399.1 50S ribosomal protein P1 [Candidatus Woesearchaeota archaeon]|tara:strand:- start:893 stop:1183 length:291 start_codon:yes stop_codon:yes gene_type:complete
MEYVYAALLIHKAGGKVEEASVKKVLEAAGIQPDEARLKALCAALQDVNIDEAVEKAATVAAPAGDAAPKEEKKKEEKKEEVNEEQAAAGLSALFG